MSLPLTWVLFCPQNRTSARIHIHVTYFDIHAGLVTKHNDNFRQRAKVYVWLKEVHGDDVSQVQGGVGGLKKEANAWADANTEGGGRRRRRRGEFKKESCKQLGRQSV